MDTSNDYFVGARAGNITVMQPPREMTKEQAIRFAAWLVTMADQSEDHAAFTKVLDAIEAI